LGWTELMVRRLAAILAADVVGYSRLMAVDEAGTHARLKALRKDFIEPRIAKHHGRVAKLMGDGALVEFGSVVDAVECAAALQNGVAERQAALPEQERIAFRIGINIGDVIIEGDDIYGDGVNVAARLEQLAGPGGICVARNVYNQVKNKVAFGFEPMGEHRVKNIPEPVVVYRLVADPGLVAKTLGRKRAGIQRWWWGGGAIAAVVLAAIATAGWPRLWEQVIERVEESTPEASALDTSRIAVLPFVNMSADAENEYFSDGITEELITQLSKIGQLSVIARTSVMKYKSADKSIIEIGRELNVGTILEGSVRKQGDQVRVTAQLIDVASEAHLWAENYDRELAGIFAVQSDIAEEVADSLKITLTEQDQRKIERAGTSNVEAYELYLRALHAHDQGHVPADVEMLQKAIALDPVYAEAYAALSDFYNALIWYTDISPVEAHRQARKYAERALALDDTLARARLALAVAAMYQFDWETADREFQRAIALNPSFARAHQLYGHFFLVAVMRRDDDAWAAITRALELDPLSAQIWESAGWVRHHRQEPDLAIPYFRRKQEMAPDDPWAYIGVGQNLIFKGDHEAGIAELQRAIEVSPNYEFLLAYLAWGYGMTDQLDAAEDVVARLKAAAETEDISPMAFAWAYTGMGYKGQAVDSLERAYEARDGSVIMLRVPEFYNVLSSEPRYHALLKKMGLEPDDGS
jgi:adenylate cyclase